MKNYAAEKTVIVELDPEFLPKILLKFLLEEPGVRLNLKIMPKISAYCPQITRQNIPIMI